MRGKLSRRQFLLASGVYGIASLGGCSQDQQATATPTSTEATSSPTPTKTDTDTPIETAGAENRQTGPVLNRIEYFVVNVVGSRTDEGTSLFKFGYRSSRSLQMETDVGGSVVSQNGDNGIELRISLTADDGYGGAGVSSQLLELSEISRIQIQSEATLGVVLRLGTSYNDETIFEWEQENDNLERVVDLDGDKSAFAGQRAGPTITIDRDDQVFNPQSDSPDSLADLEERHGNVPVRVGAALGGGTVPWAPDDLERETVLSEFVIE